MAFPQDPLGFKGYLLINGEWVPVSPAPYTRDPITHTRGRAYRANAADPTELTSTFPNRDGRYSPRNAEGPYYGYLTRNTPFKGVIPGGDSVHLELTGGTDRATTPSTAALNVAGNLDARIDLRLDNWAPTVGEEIELFGKYLLTGNQRSWQISISASRSLGIRASTDGNSASMYFPLVPIPIPPSGRTTLRVTRDNTTGVATFYTGLSVNGPWTQFGSPVTMPAGAIFASTAPLTIGDIDTLIARPPLGAVYAAQLRNGIDGTIVMSVDFTAQTLGAASFTDGTGLPWTLDADAAIADNATRFELEIPEWPPKWSTSEADAWTPIAAAGITRRLSQGQKPLDSTLRRRIPSGGPLAYWPLEDGVNATQFYSPTQGVRPLTTTGMSLAAEDSLPGSNALPTIQGVATIAGTVPAPSSTPNQWHTEFVFKTPGSSGPATARTMLQWLSTGTVRRWRLMVVAGGCELYGYDADDNTVTSSLLSLSTQIYGVWCRWQLWAVQNGGNVDWSYRFVPIGGSGSGIVTTSYAGTIGRISGVSGPTGGYSSDLNGTGLGHLAALPTANSTIYNSADLAFNGETAGARLRRLCAEERVPLLIIGDVADTQLVGPQRPAALLDLLRDAAEADGGIFGDSRVRGLQYRTRASLYNQAPVLTLDYAAKQIAPPLEPVEDDQIRNEWTVERNGGSSAVAMLETGPLSIEDIGYYPDSKTLALYSDDQTEPRAGWELHLSTWNEARYPSLTLRLHRHPEFIPAVMAMDVGDKIRILNLPKRFAGGGTVELLVDSWEETFLPRKWEITLNCAPAGPWDVAQLATYESFEDAVLEVAATNGGNAAWARSQLHFNSGAWSLRSGAISNNQTSDWTVAIPLGSTEMRFWYWTSSEAAGAGFEGDRLLVLVDGVQKLRAQGTTPWTQAIVDVTDATSVTFRYAKDNSTAVGEDAAHIDDLSFTGIGPVRLDTDGAVLAADATNTATALVVATNADEDPVAAVWTRDPVELPLDVRAGGEVIRATAIASWCTDTFTRTVSGGWGTADTGQTWQAFGGTLGTDFAVGSGYGQHILTTANVSRRCGLPLTVPDADVYVNITTSATATGGSLYGGPVVRYVDVDNLYMLRVEFTTANAILLDLRLREAAVESSLATYTTGLTHTPGTFIRARLQVRDTMVRAKVWPLGRGEPDWQIIVEDGSVQTANFVGCRSISAAANTNVNPQLRYDAFEVVNPQTWTVARSINGVVKPQVTGTGVALATPAVIAL